MRADEYLMAPSLLDKPGLRDDKLRGIKQRRGGRGGVAQRGVAPITEWRVQMEAGAANLEAARSTLYRAFNGMLKCHGN